MARSVVCTAALFLLFATCSAAVSSSNGRALLQDAEETPGPLTKEDTLDNEIAAAETAQAIGITNSVTSDIIEAAGPAQLASGDGDINTVGECADDINVFCPFAEPGKGQLYDCLQNQLKSEAAGTSEVTTAVSTGCKQEIEAFKIDRSTNVNKNLPLALACRADAEKLCGHTKDMDEQGKVLACLRENKEALTQGCRSEVAEEQLEAANDWKADPQLAAACADDVTKVCGDVPPRDGKVQECLRANRIKLNWPCQEQLFRQRVENADDIRLSVKLFNKCRNDKKTFCEDVNPGQARVKSCLEEHRSDPGFSEECKAELEVMMEARAKDFRLDVNVRTHCRRDIDEICALQQDSMTSVESDDASVIECLQDFKDELMQPNCKKAVKKTMQRAAMDLRFDVSLQEACQQDRNTLCRQVPRGDARVVTCLQDRRAELSGACAAALFDNETLWAEDIDLQYTMKVACGQELSKFCAKVAHGGGRAIRCLQQHTDKPEFGGICKNAVAKFESWQSADYRLNYQLSESCAKDVSNLCGEVCPDELASCGGQVLRCLTTKSEEIKEEACAKEVLYFEKMEVNNYGNDVILATACKADVEAHCKKVKPGEGRVHQCLRDHRAEVSPACSREEFKLEALTGGNIDLQPGLNRACKDERTQYCSKVSSGKSRVFRCLVENLAMPDVSDNCRQAIITKVHRRQENWRLDVNLRRACQASVLRECSAEDQAAGDTAGVQKCLVANASALDQECVKELSRVVHMSMVVYKPNGALTGVCDEDVKTQCLAVNPKLATQSGKVGECLLEVAEKAKAGFVSGADLMTPVEVVAEGTAAPEPGPVVALSDACAALLSVSETGDVHDGYKRDLEQFGLRNMMSRLQSATNLPLMADGGDVITLTGWTAMLGMLSLCLVLVGLGLYTYRKMAGMPEDQGYQMVVKSGAKDGDV